MNQYVLCLVNYKAQFTRGKIYKIRRVPQIEHDWISIEEDDSKQPNGWCKRFFILLFDEKKAKLARLFYL